MIQLLLVEDDANLRLVLRHILMKEGYALDEARTAEEGLKRIRRGGVDLLILDLMLPGMGGKEALALLRSQGYSLPVIILSALGEEAQRVEGFLAGCDDYMVKPFSGKELVLRINAILTRRNKKRGGIVQCGELEIDLGKREVSLGGIPIQLTGDQLSLLGTLAMRAPHAVHRDDLLRALGWKETAATRAVDQHMSRLRKRLGAASALLETVPGYGYRLALMEK
ncbi:response regulator transcription factor [bacterium]|nr:response regulator transcription factor [bacterium]